MIACAAQEHLYLTGIYDGLADQAVPAHYCSSDSLADQQRHLATIPGYAVPALA